MIKLRLCFQTEPPWSKKRNNKNTTPSSNQQQLFSLSTGLQHISPRLCCLTSALGRFPSLGPLIGNVQGYGCAPLSSPTPTTQHCSLAQGHGHATPTFVPSSHTTGYCCTVETGTLLLTVHGTIEEASSCAPGMQRLSVSPQLHLHTGLSSQSVLQTHTSMD